MTRPSRARGSAGLHLSVQVLGLVLAAVLLAALVSLAVLAWLERAA